MAFLCVLVSLLVVIVIWKGSFLKEYSLVKDDTEDGVALFEDTERQQAIDTE